MPSEPERPLARSSRDSTTSIGDVVQYVTTYAKQETLGPLRGAGRWLAFGGAGALLLGIGLLLVVLGVLRAVQTEWDRLARGSLSWAPYVLALVLCGALLALVLTRINRDELNEDRD